MEQNSLSTQDVYGGDPLAGWLLGRRRLRPAILALIGLLIGAGFQIGLAAAFGYFLPRPGIIAGQSDYFNLLNFFVVFPAIMFYYLWQPAQIAQVYSVVVVRLGAQGEAFQAWKRAVLALHARREVWLIGASVALLGMGVGVYDNLSRLGAWWYAANGLMIGILQAMRGVIFYMLTVSVIRHIAASIGLSRLYPHFPIPVRLFPLQRDEGMGIITRYAFSFTAIAAVVGLNLGTAPLLTERMGVDYPFQVLAYFLLAPLGFFLPLWQAHRHMVRNKNRLLADLARQCRAEHTRLLTALAEDSPGTLAQAEKAHALFETYELARKSPTWPFDTATLYRLGATIVAPFMFTVRIILEQIMSR